MGKGIASDRRAECLDEHVGATAKILLARQQVKADEIGEHGGIGIGRCVIVGVAWPKDKFRHLPRREEEPAFCIVPQIGNGSRNQLTGRREVMGIVL